MERSSTGRMWPSPDGDGTVGCVRPGETAGGAHRPCWAVQRACRWRYVHSRFVSLATASAVTLPGAVSSADLELFRSSPSM